MPTEIDSSEWIVNRRRAKSRLPRLARWLRAISRHLNGAKFNLDLVASAAPQSLAEAKSCGFEGCVLGWAPLEPSFRKAGLKLVSMRGECGRHEYDVELRGFSPDCNLTLRHSFQAAAHFFGISYEAARVIFGTAGSNWHKGPKTAWAHDWIKRLPDHDPMAAAGRVERFCRDNGIEV